MLGTDGCPVCCLLFCFSSPSQVFQYGLFSSLNSALSRMDSVFWLGPVLTFSLVVGLALDYDIFLTSRVREMRQLGYTDRAAIIKGCSHTGMVSLFICVSCWLSGFCL